MRLFGSDFHNFVYDESEYKYSGKDVLNQKAHVVIDEEEAMTEYSAFEKDAFFAYLDFDLKVFLR